MTSAPDDPSLHRAVLDPVNAFRPVLLFRHRGEACVPASEILGTAFSIGGEFLMTAAHVADETSSDDAIPAEVLQHNRSFRMGTITEIEKLPGDIGILRLASWGEGFQDFLPRPMTWSTRETLLDFETVRAFGYAFGLQRLDDRRSSEILRAFQGHIVARQDAFTPIGSDCAFAVYEFSFQALRGLSGSPLIFDAGVQYGHPQADAIAGVVIGNSESSMLVHSSTETENLDNTHRGETTTIVERYETLRLGIATRLKSYFSQNAMVASARRFVNGFTLTVGPFLARCKTQLMSRNHVLGWRRIRVSVCVC